MTSIKFYTDGDEFTMIIRALGIVDGKIEVEFETILDDFHVVTKAWVSYPVSVDDVANMFDQFADGIDLFTGNTGNTGKNGDIVATKEDLAVAEAINRELLSKRREMN